MSDQSISLVPNLSKYPDREKKASEILDWLINEKIIENSLSDCTLGGPGYRFMKNAEKIIIGYPRIGDLVTQGLEISIEKQVYHAGDSGLDSILCPNCKKNTLDEELEMISQWFEADSSIVKCFLCDYESDINDFEFSPTFGFSNLRFTFWNIQELTDDFVKTFEEKLDCKLKIVYTHI